jgi:REP element-mobilizing transposase RayT
MERYRFHADGALFYVTFSVVDWLPVFVSEGACRIVTDSLTYCHRHKGLRVNAYVIMPTHLHGIVFHETFTAKAIEQTLTDFRKFTGRQLADYCGEHAPPAFGDVFGRRAGMDRERRFWQPSRHPVQLETEAFWQAKLDYLHENPCRKGLVRQPEHWRFSSAAFWLAAQEEAGDVPLSAVQW